MRKRSKKMLGAMVALGMLMCVSISSLAAWGNFSVALPMYQSDTEASKIAKSNDGTTYFTIDISSISATATAARVWTEGPAGRNYSSTANQAGEGRTSFDYHTQPGAGTNVVLNLDNPVYTNIQPVVTGRWTPN